MIIKNTETQAEGECLGFLGSDIGQGMVIVRVGNKLDKWPFHGVEVVETDKRAALVVPVFGEERVFTPEERSLVREVSEKFSKKKKK